MTQVLQSFIGGQWIGQQGAQALRSAINGQTVYQTHAEAIDFGDAVHYARTVGLSNLLKLDFQERAQRLKALAKYLGEHKEQLYAISAHTGATRADSWVDIEGGAGTLFAYSGMGSNELPSGNLIHEGPAFPLGKKGGFAGTHILVPRGGIAVHINAFNFPIWGLLEKFAPSFLAGMPCIGKPASSTSYLTEAMVRLVEQSGILPAGALQLVIGSTGDLLDRLNGQDVVTFTGSADTAAMLRVHPNVVKHSIPFNAEADSLNCAILAPDVSPDDEEFDLFVKEVAREMTVKAGQKCTAIRRAIVPRQHLDAVAEKLKARLAKVVVGDPSVEGVKMGALASHSQQADVAERVALLRQSTELVFGGGADFSPVGQGVEGGAFFQPTLLLCQKPLHTDSVHDVEAFGPVSTLMPYDGIDEALQLAARGQGSLVGTLVTKDPQIAARIIPVAAALHGRLHTERGTAQWELSLDRSDEVLYHFASDRLYHLPWPKKKIITRDCFLRFRGRISCAGITVEGDFMGMNGHNWGTEHAHEYAYADCNMFAEDEGACFDGFSVKVAVARGLLKSPFLSMCSLKAGGRWYHFNALADSWKHRVEALDDYRWIASFQNGTHRLELSINGQNPRVEPWVALHYDHPGGARSVVKNTKFASARLRLLTQGDHRLVTELTSDFVELETLLPDNLPSNKGYAGIP